MRPFMVVLVVTVLTGAVHSQSGIAPINDQLPNPYQAGVRNPMLNGMLVVAVFSVIYFGVTHLAGVPDAAAFIRRVRGARRPE